MQKKKRTNFFISPLSAILAVVSFGLGMKYQPGSLGEVLMLMLTMTVGATVIDYYGNKFIHLRLLKKKREDREKQIVEYSRLISKAKPRKRKTEVSKRKKR